MRTGVTCACIGSQDEHALCCAALEHRPVHACLPVTAHPMHWVQRPQAEPQWPVILLPDLPEPTSCWGSLLGCDIRARPTPTIGQTGRGHVGWAAACCVLCAVCIARLGIGALRWGICQHGDAGREASHSMPSRH